MQERRREESKTKKTERERQESHLRLDPAIPAAVTFVLPIYMNLYIPFLLQSVCVEFLLLAPESSPIQFLYLVKMNIILCRTLVTYFIILVVTVIIK